MCSPWHRWQRDLKIDVAIMNLHGVLTSTLCNLVNSISQIAPPCITSGNLFGTFSTAYSGNTICNLHAGRQSGLPCFKTYPLFAASVLRQAVFLIDSVPIHTGIYARIGVASLGLLFCVLAPSPMACSLPLILL